MPVLALCRFTMSILCWMKFSYSLTTISILPLLLKIFARSFPYLDLPCKTYLEITYTFLQNSTFRIESSLKRNNWFSNIPIRFQRLVTCLALRVFTTSLENSKQPMVFPLLIIQSPLISRCDSNTHSFLFIFENSLVDGKAVFFFCFIACKKRRSGICQSSSFFMTIFMIWWILFMEWTRFHQRNHHFLLQLELGTRIFELDLYLL